MQKRNIRDFASPEKIPSPLPRFLLLLLMMMIDDDDDDDDDVLVKFV